jgi:hypothetical protein
MNALVVCLNLDCSDFPVEPQVLGAYRPVVLLW